MEYLPLVDVVNSIGFPISLVAFLMYWMRGIIKSHRDEVWQNNKLWRDDLIELNKLYSESAFRAEKVLERFITILGERPCIKENANAKH